ncbi:MAG TPA: FkbM family methyltransferase [Thermoanaerobaculia bacterium]
MRLTETPLAGAFIIDIDPSHDERGFFARTFDADALRARGLDADFAQGSISFNPRKGTLRGMHFQAAPHEEAKIARCTRGAIFDVIIDLATGKWFGLELSAENRRALYIPRGFAHGFLTLEDDTEVSYQIATPYAPDSVSGLRWNDPAIGIEWPFEPRVISERDAGWADWLAVGGCRLSGDPHPTTTEPPATRHPPTANPAETIIQACLALESQHPFTTIRDERTGPIVDALFANVATVRKELSNGIVFEFPYRSKIARDFVMSVPSKPDHVWEPQTTKLLLHLADGSADVLVGGAYFGDHAILLADRIRNTRALCHAFEPDAEQAAMLAHNARLNHLSNVRVNTFGLWSDNETKLAFVGHDALASTVASDDGIATITIDSYVREQNIARLGLIMLDLEGAELHALQGASQQLARENAPHLVFEVHRSYVDWSDGLMNTDLCRFVASFGYRIFAIRDMQSNYDLSGRPIELVPPETAYLDGPPHGFNMLATKDASLIDSPLFRITPNVSPKLLLHRDPALHHPTGGL